MFVQVHPVIDYSTRDLCARPYPGHPQGCPNYGRLPACPPQAPFFDRYFDMARPVFAIYVQFDLERFVRFQQQKHPELDEQEVRLGKSWHSQARRLLINNIRDFLAYHSGYSVVFNPEAMGVNVNETMARVGVNLTWQEPPQCVLRIAMAGVKLPNAL